MNSAIENFRESKKLYNLIGLMGTIISLTRINSSSESFIKPNQFFVALAKMENNINLMLPLISNSENPKIKDKVTIVLRRVKSPTKSEIVEYGLKFRKIN